MRWIRSWLKGRLQWVMMKREWSVWKVVVSGVPQVKRVIALSLATVKIFWARWLAQSHPTVQSLEGRGQFLLSAKALTTRAKKTYPALSWGLQTFFIAFWIQASIEIIMGPCKGPVSSLPHSIDLSGPDTLERSLGPLNSVNDATFASWLLTWQAIWEEETKNWAQVPIKDLCT